MGAVNECPVEVVREDDATVTVRLRGEIDLASAPAVESAVRAALPDPPVRVVFDLGELQFMDSSGIAVLLRLACDAAGVSVRNPTPTVAMVIESTGLSEILRVDDA